MTLRHFFQQIEEPRELLLYRPFTLVLLFLERLHQRGEIGIEIRRLRRPEVRVENILSGSREQGENIGLRLDEETSAEIGDVVDEEDGAKGWPLSRP